MPRSAPPVEFAVATTSVTLAILTLPLAAVIVEAPWMSTVAV